MRLSAFSIFVALSLRVAHAKLYESIDALPAEKPFDFIVVGGGVGGSVVASRLSEDPNFNVLLIEAGPNNEGVEPIQIPGYQGQINGTYDWGYVTVPQSGLNNRKLAYTRGHVLGGSSSINGMVYTRGAADDYDLWAKVTGDSGWSWKELLPLIKRHERWVPPADGRNVTGQYDPQYHGFDGNTLVSLPGLAPNEFDERTIRNTEFNKEFPYNVDVNSGHPIGLSWMQSTIGHGERSSAAAAFLGPAVRARPNLSILIDTYASRVLPTGTGPLDLRTIEIGSRSGKSVTKALTATKELILAAGAIGSAHILLNSGIGDKADLEAVGVARAPAPPFVDPAVSYQQWVQNRTGALTQLNTVHQILWSRIPAESSIWKDYPDPSTGPGSPHVEYILNGAGLAGGAVILLSPASTGTVKIGSNDPFADPVIDLGFLTNTFDVLALKEAVRLAKRFFTGPEWTNYLLAPVHTDPDTVSDAAFEAVLRNGAFSLAHPVGTAAMSAKGAETGVVDPDLRMKGVSGLRIVDASVIPYVPAAHTQASVYAVAERAVDLIRAAFAT